MKTIKLFLTALVLVQSLVGTAYAQSTQETRESKEEDPVSRSWIPIAGYNSTYGFFGGGGFFYANDEFTWHLFGIVTQTAVMKADLAFANKLTENWYFNNRNELGHGFEPIYGEGSLTRAIDRRDLTLWKISSQFQFDYWFNNNLAIGPLVDIRSHRSFPVPPGSLLDPPRREDAFGVGVVQQLDYRNIPENASYGWYEALTLQVVPALSQPRDLLFGVVDLDLRFFQQMTKQVVFAVQVAGGSVLGNSTYLFQPRLGGTNRLRGYYDNRFRGNHYYLEQTELRFPIWKALSGVSFLEFGEATNDKFGAPNVSAGFGIRVGLPPDYISQIRVDVGFGKDQYGIFFDFGHSF